MQFETKTQVRKILDNEPNKNPINLHGLLRYNVRVESTLQIILKSRTSLIGRTRKIKLFFTKGKSELCVAS